MVIDKPLPCRFPPTKLPRKPFSVFPDLRDLRVLRARPPSLVRENNAKQILQRDVLMENHFHLIATTPEGNLSIEVSYPTIGAM